MGLSRGVLPTVTTVARLHIFSHVSSLGGEKNKLVEYLPQAVSSGHSVDGERRGPEPPYVVFAGSARTHFPVAGQQSRSAEHGKAGHAARGENPRCARSALGVRSTER